MAFRQEDARKQAANFNSSGDSRYRTGPDDYRSSYGSRSDADTRHGHRRDTNNGGRHDRHRDMLASPRNRQARRRGPVQQKEAWVSFPVPPFCSAMQTAAARNVIAKISAIASPRYLDRLAGCERVPVGAGLQWTTASGRLQRTHSDKDPRNE